MRGPPLYIYLDPKMMRVLRKSKFLPKVAGNRTRSTVHYPLSYHFTPTGICVHSNSSQVIPRKTQLKTILFNDGHI